MGASLRTRLVVLSAAAVVVAAGALCVLQYRSLAQLEAKSRVAARADLVRIARVVGQTAETEISRRASEALTGFTFTDGNKSALELGQRFDAIRENHPEIDQIFLFAPDRKKGIRAVFSARRGAQEFT